MSYASIGAACGAWITNPQRVTFTFLRLILITFLLWVSGPNASDHQTLIHQTPPRIPTSLHPAPPRSTPPRSTPPLIPGQLHASGGRVSQGDAGVTVGWGAAAASPVSASPHGVKHVKRSFSFSAPRRRRLSNS